MSKTSGIEEEVFQCLRFVPEKMIAYGFQREENQFIYETDFMDGAFHLILTVSNKGDVHGHVIDTMNEEEYWPLRSDHYGGSYVATVREKIGNYWKRLPKLYATVSCLPHSRPIGSRT